MTLDDLKRIALSTRSQSFVSIEVWELLALIEIAEACERIGFMCENPDRPLCRRCHKCDMCAISDTLSKLTSDGEG